jgi:hypothetical protein
MYKNTLFNDLKKAAKSLDKIELNFETVELKEIFHYIQPKAFLSNEEFVEENNTGFSLMKKKSSSNLNTNTNCLSKWSNAAWDMIK